MAESQTIGKPRISLPEVNQSVPTGHQTFLRRMLAFAGPAYLVSVGYMDPGNWVTDLEGGARFGYRLLWVLVLSNLVALLLQTLSARLGIVTGRDLAQSCREHYSRRVSFILWLLCELAIAACDLAEVLGAAIGLNVLFHIPLLAGVCITALDTLLVLWFSRLGIRVIEAFVLVLIGTIAGCFLFEILLAKPNPGEMFSGLLPRLNSSTLYAAVAIFGATVMPHNLYLHSALVQTRRFGSSFEEKRTACRFNLVDSTIALNGALFVNAAILVMAAAVFFKRNIIVTELEQAHQLLAPLLGTTAASVLFGAALLCSGQSSTLTGTMAGQIVMEGFLHFRMQPWLRRAITRFVAITPAIIAVYLMGNAGAYQMILLSQVILSLQLPFAVIPLVLFTSDRRQMGALANPRSWKIAAWACTLFILVLNAWLVWQQFVDWGDASGRFKPLVLGIGTVLGIGVLILLWNITARPAPRKEPATASPVFSRAVEGPFSATPVHYSRILVPLDHTPSDHEAIANALPLARAHNARLMLLHVEEDVTSVMFGAQSSTAEIQEGRDYLEALVSELRGQSVEVDVLVSHGRVPAQEIARAAIEQNADLIVMASHGHRGIKDLIFGTTINSVRHHVKTPMLIVRDSSPRQ